jgi:hypothetical protein
MDRLFNPVFHCPLRARAVVIVDCGYLRYSIAGFLLIGSGVHVGTFVVSISVEVRWLIYIIFQ